MTGLVDRSISLTFEQIRRFPKRTIKSVFVCSGDPRRPTLPLRRVANVRWGGADLAELLDHAGVQQEATHLWSYGLDHGEFLGFAQRHYVKDMPLSRLKHGNVLVAYEMNDKALARENGFPARLLIPGFYGTNCVKWLCRLELRERRAVNFMTTRLYNDPDFDADRTGETTRPVWAVAPESVIVAPKPYPTASCHPVRSRFGVGRGPAVRSNPSISAPTAARTGSKHRWSRRMGFRGSAFPMSGGRLRGAHSTCVAAPRI